MPQQLQESTNSLHPDYWSGTGFGAAEELEIGVRMRQVINTLDQGSAGSIESLKINPPAKGIIGSEDDGPLIVDCANSADSVVRNAGEVDLRIQAAAASKVTNITNANNRARTRCLGGQFDYGSITAGRMTFAQAATLTNFYGLGGQTVINYNSTGITGACDMVRGVHTIKRRASLIRVGGDATLILDLDPQISTLTGDKILLMGGNVILLNGLIPEIEGIGGVFDYSKARQAHGSALGATQHDLAGTQVIPNPDVTPTAPAYLAGIYRNETGPVAINGSLQQQTA